MEGKKTVLKWIESKPKDKREQHKQQGKRWKTTIEEIKRERKKIGREGNNEGLNNKIAYIQMKYY